MWNRDLRRAKKAAVMLFELRYPNPDERPLFVGSVEREWVERAWEFLAQLDSSELAVADVVDLGP